MKLFCQIFSKTAPTPPEKPLHLKSQSRSCFWKSRSPDKHSHSLHPWRGPRSDACGSLGRFGCPSRSPCRAASGASSPVARSAGWAAGTRWLAGARAIDGVVAWAPLGVSLASIAALPANQLRICSSKCKRFTLVPNQEIYCSGTIIWGRSASILISLRKTLREIY